jgi:type IV pilus assembly protein PilM
VACEISSQHIAAARGAQGSLAMTSVRRLPSGAVHPNLATANITQPEVLRRSLSESLSAVGGGGRHVTLVLPDAAVRVLLLDFETLPNDRNEAEAIIRFRLKKTLPFDVDHCALSFDPLQSNGNVRALVAVSPVVAEYEQVIRDAGYEPGVVVPSVLANLGNLTADRPALMVKIDPETTSMVLADANGIRLLRTIEHPSGAFVNEELLKGVHSSLIYYEDNFGHQVTQVYLAGANVDPTLKATLAHEFQIRVDDLIPGSAGSDTALLTGVEGALA